MLNEAINIKYTTLASKEFWVYSFTGTVLCGIVLVDTPNIFFNISTLMEVMNKKTIFMHNQ